MAMCDGRQVGTGPLTLVKAAIFLSGPNIHQKISRDILSERMFVRGSKFDVFRQIFIIYMLKINFTHVALSGKS
jgi:hypothetical protein